MGALIRNHKWSTTTVGSPDQWPTSLRTTLGIMLHSDFPMFLFWGHDALCFYNDAFRVSLGENGKHPALGKQAVEVWAEAWNFVSPLIERVKNSGELVSFADQLVPFYRNGGLEDSYWTCSYSPVFGESDQIDGVVVTCTETTRMVQARQEVEEKRRDLDLALDLGDLGTFKLDLLQKTAILSERLQNWCGFSQPEVSITTLLSLISPADQAAVQAIWASDQEPGSDGRHDITYRVTDPATGQFRFLHSLGQTQFENGQAHTIYGTVQDVTEQITAQQEFTLAVNEQRKLLSILNYTREYIGMAAADTSIIYKNPAFLDALGWDTFEGKYVRDCVYPDDLPLVQELLTELADKDHFSQAIRFVHEKTGMPIWVQWNVVANRDRITGELVGIVAVAQNISQQRESQQALRESEERYRLLAAVLEEQVQNRTEELVLSNEELREANHLLSLSNSNLEMFAYVASHDLQEPLRKILSFGNILKDTYMNELGDGLEHLVRMQSAASRMSTLIRDLLMYSRVAATQRESVEPVSLTDVVQTVLYDLELRIQETGATITVGSLPMLQGNCSQLEQLFQNLLSNALKFRQKTVSPVIQLSSRLLPAAELPPRVIPTRLAEEYYQIDVADNGIGFDEKYLDRIFQVFQRLNGKSQYAGTGIGLAICDKVVANHGGAITASSQPNQGATFSLFFPNLSS